MEREDLPSALDVAMTMTMECSAESESREGVTLLAHSL